MKDNVEWMEKPLFVARYIISRIVAGLGIRDNWEYLISGNVKGKFDNIWFFKRSQANAISVRNNTHTPYYEASPSYKTAKLNDLTINSKPAILYFSDIFILQFFLEN